MTVSYSKVTEFYVVPSGWPLLLLLTALLFDGFGVFLAYDVAQQVPVFSNPVVLFGLVHAAVCIAFALLLLVVRWSWTVTQHGLIGMIGMLGFAYFFLGSYFGILLNDRVPLYVKLLMILALLVIHGYYIARVSRPYFAAWRQPDLRELIYIEHEDHFLYSLYGDKAVREKLGIDFNPRVWFVITGFVLGFVPYFFKADIRAATGINWVPVAWSIWGLTLSTLTTAMLTAVACLYFIFPSLLRRQSSKPIYIDMVSPVNAKDAK